MALTSIRPRLEVRDLHTTKMHRRAHNVMTMHEPVDHVDTGLQGRYKPVRLHEPDPTGWGDGGQPPRHDHRVTSRVLTRGVMIEIRIDRETGYGCPGPEVVLEGQDAIGIEYQNVVAWLHSLEHIIGDLVPVLGILRIDLEADHERQEQREQARTGHHPRYPWSRHANPQAEERQGRGEQQDEVPVPHRDAVQVHERAQYEQRYHDHGNERQLGGALRGARAPAAHDAHQRDQGNDGPQDDHGVGKA